MEDGAPVSLPDRFRPYDLHEELRLYNAGRESATARMAAAPPAERYELARVVLREIGEEAGARATGVRDVARALIRFVEDPASWATSKDESEAGYQAACTASDANHDACAAILEQHRGCRSVFECAAVRAAHHIADANFDDYVGGYFNTLDAFRDRSADAEARLQELLEKYKHEPIDDSADWGVIGALEELLGEEAVARVRAPRRKAE